MIYLAKCGDYYKIGYTSGDAAKRIASLQTGNPIPIELIGTVQGDQKTETDLHVRFARKRVRGEWFTLDQDDIESILAPVKLSPLEERIAWLDAHIKSTPPEIVAWFIEQVKALRDNPPV